MKKLPQFLMDMDEEYRDRLGQEDARDMELVATQHAAASLVAHGESPEKHGFAVSFDGRWHYFGAA